MSEQQQQLPRPYAHAGGKPSLTCKHCGGKGFITWDLTKLGDRIRYSRDQVNMSIEELAQKTEIHVSNLRRYEENINEPKLATLRKIAKALDAPVGFLAGD
jgi:DNA-binding XRE family transcriptional regulator